MAPIPITELVEVEMYGSRTHNDMIEPSLMAFTGSTKSAGYCSVASTAFAACVADKMTLTRNVEPTVAEAGAETPNVAPAAAKLLSGKTNHAVAQRATSADAMIRRTIRKKGTRQEQLVALYHQSPQTSDS